MESSQLTFRCLYKWKAVSLRFVVFINGKQSAYVSLSLSMEISFTFRSLYQCQKASFTFRFFIDGKQSAYASLSLSMESNQLTFRCLYQWKAASLRFVVFINGKQSASRFTVYHWEATSALIGYKAQ
jgi:hypothetical protein